MKILGYILTLIIAISFLIGWIFYRDEMKSFVGIPQVAKVNKVGETNTETNNPGQPAREKSRSEPTLNPDTEKPPEASKEEAIQMLLTQRYPDVPVLPFEEKYPSIRDVPDSILPDRIQTNEPVKFALKQGDRLLAASFVKAGGMVQPVTVTADGASLEIRSLANSDLKSIIPVSQTDFLEQLKSRYVASQEEAVSRIKKIRRADAFLLSSYPELFSKLEKDPMYWDAADAPGYRRYLEALKSQLNPATHQVTGFFTEGRIHVETEQMNGTFTTLIARIEGTRHGFGPYVWRARGIVDKGKVVEWVDLP